MSELYKILCRTDIYIPDLCEGFRPKPYSSLLTPNMIFWCLKSGKHTVLRCQHCAIFLWHLDRSCASLHTDTHLHLFFPIQSNVSKADVLLTHTHTHTQIIIIICGENMGGDMEGKIYEYANLVTVWNLVEWEMLLPSFIMQRSLLNARQLGLVSSIHPPPPPVI